MPPSDTQQSEAMSADSTPEPPSNEAPAPNTPDASLTDVDDLLEQVQNLTQDIIEDASTTADSIEADDSIEAQPGPSSALPPVLELATNDEELEASDEADADMEIDAIGESEIDMGADGDVEAASNADDKADGDGVVGVTEDATTVEAANAPSESDDEAFAILDSLQSETQMPDGVLEVDPEGQLVGSAVDASNSDIADADTNTRPAGELEDGPTESLRQNGIDDADGTAANRTIGVAESSVDDDAELPDLLQDPDGEEAPKVQSVLVPTGTEDIASKEIATEAAATPVEATLSKDSHKGTRQPGPRWWRVTHLLLQKAIYRVRYSVTHPAQLLKSIMAAPRYLFAVFDRGLAWMDRPFAEMSPQKKQLIGIVALATLLAGVLIWVLPMIAFTNPFEGMSRGISSGP